MIKQDVRRRFTNDVIFTAEIACAPDASTSVRLGLAIAWGAKNKIDMTGANMAGANMAGADMAGADMTRATMTRANMAGANMAGADMAGADMAGADMTRANMAGANMTGVILKGCKGADMGSGKAPIQLYGLIWPVTITDTLMKIGCQQHTFATWRDFSDADISAMETRALAFWTAHKTALFTLIEASGRTV